MTFLTKDPKRSNSNPMISLEMIIMMQKDEPNQKSCIYKMQTKRLVPDAQGKGQREEIVEKYFQIRVKSVEFMQKRAIALYFYNFTWQLQSFNQSRR